MQTLLPELLEADVLVLAAPLYVDGMTGPLKMVVDRMIPLGEPKIECREDHCRHPGRSAVRDRQLLPRDQYVAIANKHIAERVRQSGRTDAD